MADELFSFKVLYRSELVSVAKPGVRRVDIAIKSTDTFTCTVIGSSFRVKVTADCKTRNVVHLIECSKCRVQYVRETENALHMRLTAIDRT